jgi:hypothetical protein
LLKKKKILNHGTEEMSFSRIINPILNSAWLENHVLTVTNNTAKYYFGEISSFLQTFLNPLPSGTLATFFLTAVGLIQHTKEGDISKEKTILMTSLRLERAAAGR